jgi:Superfamily II DNA helicase
MLEANGEWNESARALLRDMEKYAAGTRCRHRTLIEYFGQQYERADCGACDWCLKELDAVDDSLTIAQKILSCVARVKQTWGTAHVTDVLTGKATEKVVASRHHELSTFGLLKEEAPVASAASSSSWSATACSRAKAIRIRSCGSRRPARLSCGATAPASCIGK